MVQQPTFKADQKKFRRVKDAYTEKESTIQSYFTKKKINQEGFRLFLRAFKKEMKVEVWVKEKGKEEYALLTTYDFCSTSGQLGPKRKEGDLQIPEGIYSINHFNPVSNFYLSLGINYPNASDAILSDKHHPGGAIYIHGNCVTIGCIPITDDKIKELYILAVEAKNNGQEKISVHIFPSVLSDTGMNTLAAEHANEPTLLSFWRNLKVIYTDFEQTKKLKAVSVKRNGEYAL
jgi:murein L,D-transpeptidase YafK